MDKITNEITLIEISVDDINAISSQYEFDIFYNESVIKASKNLSHMINHEMYNDMKETLSPVEDALELLSVLFGRTIEEVEIDLTDCLESIPAYYDIQQEQYLIH